MELEPSQQAFVDATIRPLEDKPDMEDVLGAAVGTAATFPGQSGDDVSRATERMRKTGGSFKIRNKLAMGLSFAIAAMAAWTAVIGPPAFGSIKRIMLGNRIMSLMSSMCCSYRTVPPLPFFRGKQRGLEEDPLTRMIAERTSEKDRRLLLGDLREAYPVQRWKNVWDEYPDDPRHYFAYAAAYHQQHGKWPDDLVEIGERLDPGNGWFRLLKGAAKLSASIGEPKPAPAPPGKSSYSATRGWGSRAPKPPKPERMILDITLYREGIDLMEEALAMPRLDDYRRSLQGLRFGATPPVVDLADHYAASMPFWLQPEINGTGWLTLRAYSEAFSLAAADAAKRGDRRELEKIRDRSVRLSGRLVEVPSSLLSKILAKVVLVRPAKSLAQAWIDVGEPEKGKEFEFVLWRYDPKTTPFPVPPKDALDENRGSGMLAETHMGSLRAGSIPVTEPELRGGRLAEYSLYERLMLHVAAIVLFIAILYLGISGVISRGKLGLLPDRMVDLLSFRDHLWILFLGVVVPFSLYVVATRSSWLASREFALSQDRFFMWFIQALTLVALVILWCLQTICRRLKRRGSILVLGWRGLNPGAWLSAMAAATMIAGPRLLDATPDDTLLWKLLWASLVMIAGLAWLWILTLASAQIPSRERKLHRAILRRAMIPYVALALGLAALPIPLIQSEERHWVSRIDFEALRPESNMFEPRTEAEHAEWIGQQLRRAINEMKLIPHE